MEPFFIIAGIAIVVVFIVFIQQANRKRAGREQTFGRSAQYRRNEAQSEQGSAFDPPPTFMKPQEQHRQHSQQQHQHGHHHHDSSSSATSHQHGGFDAGHHSSGFDGGGFHGH